MTWAGTDSRLAKIAADYSRRHLESYEINPSFVEEHVGIERQIIEGGYGARALLELIQNGADALTESDEKGRVEVLLRQDRLYCANEGAPLTEQGLVSLLHSHISTKSGNEIGRFGQGFKAILQFTRRPIFVSRSCSIAFDADRSADKIHKAAKTSGAAPILRVAWPIDPEILASGDDDLKGLMAWATTVVVLPLLPGVAGDLEREIDSFPAPFVLFSPSVSEVVLRDPKRQVRREVSTVHRLDDAIDLLDNEEETTWRVFRRSVTKDSLSDEAIRDAGSLVDKRERFPLLWSVPMKSLRDAGRFWIFSPTSTESTVSGVFNAPWKTNNDRQNLLEGDFNRSLLREAAELVAENLPHLSSNDDLGRCLDALPARETSGWADKMLAEQLHEVLQAVDCVPSAAGPFRKPSEIQLPPRDLPEEAIEEWLASDSAKDAWAHASTLGRERFPRATKLGVEVADLENWLCSFVVRPSVANSAAAIRAAAILVRDKDTRSAKFSGGWRWELDSLRHSKIVLTKSGSLAGIDPEHLLLTGESIDGSEVVHPDLEHDRTVRKALESFGLRDSSPEELLGRLLRRPRKNWPRIWEATRKTTPEVALRVIEDEGLRSTLSVRNRAGGFVPIWSVLMPGRIVDEAVTTGRSAVAVIDADFHDQELTLLELLGLSDVPTRRFRYESESWYKKFQTEARAEYRRQLPSGSPQPQESLLEFTSPSKERRCGPGPLTPLGELEPDAQAGFCEVLFEQLEDLDEWTMGHSTQKHYPEWKVLQHPLIWRLRSLDSCIPTSLGPYPVSLAVGRDLEVPAESLPVARCSRYVAEQLGLPNTKEEMTNEHWEVGFDPFDLRNGVPKPGPFGELCAAAAKYGFKPARLACHIGQTVREIDLDDEVVVCAESFTRAEDIPCLVVGSWSQARSIARDWLMKVPIELEPSLEFDSKTEVDLEDFLPRLRNELPELKMFSCSGLSVRHVEELQEIPGGVYVDDSRMEVYFEEELGVDDLQAALCRSFGIPEPKKESPSEKKAEIRSCSTLEERLISAIGERTLESRLGRELGMSLRLFSGRATDSIDLAKAILAIYGSSALREFREVLQHNGLDPPVAWTGNRKAREFVRSLGFPDAFAGRPRVKRDSYEEVLGPIELRPLHDFQLKIASDITVALSNPNPARGLLSLPTGAGKTRVVVQALTEVMKKSEPERPLLWIAQSDELCEQALESWKEVWSAIGPPRPIRIDRFWGNQTPKLRQAPVSIYQLVIATPGTLTSRLNRGELSWLKDPEVVIIDEAHHSIAPSYTKILKQLGLTHRETARSLIGLTATPFRGVEEEARRLVNRYHEKRFDHVVFGPDSDPYSQLQDEGVLARVEHQLLEGVHRELNRSELEYVERYRTLPSNIEVEIGRDAPRNDRILRVVEDFPRDWPVLVFATSVDHAEALAALLAVRGKPARAVSSETHRSERIEAVEEFRAGEVQILTNYMVLTAGFDAPAVRAIVVARPVWSPILYQQMVGRGLRGPKNGGKPVCLLVNVEDNIRNYSDRLAFRDFEVLWSGRESPGTAGNL